jgi:hypothetical protein
MKKIFYCLIVSSVFFTSCKKFLEQTPNDFLSPQNYYNTKPEIDAALTGVYDNLGKSATYGRYLYFEMDQADDSYVGLSSWTQDISLYNADASDAKLNATWTTLYEGINRANALLENIDKSSIKDSEKQVVKGEALFLRAYYYFLLVTNWGDVPLRLASTKSTADVDMPRTPYKQVYYQIVSDMEAAADLVNPISNYNYGSRVTKSAVWGILARVNLKMAGAPLRETARYADAKKWAEKVINTNLHALNNDYAQVFKNLCADTYDTKEVIWEIEFNKLNSSQNEEGALGSINGIGTSSTTIGYSYGAKKTTASFFNSFGTGDLRRDWTLNNYTYNTVAPFAKIDVPVTASPFTRFDSKWRREYETALPKFNGTTSINFPVLRYSDVLLMYAEAENEVNGPALAYAKINEVRRRAYGVALGKATNAQADLPAGKDKIDFRTAVRKERNLELAYEGLRRFDLIRWGDFLTAIKNAANEISTQGGTNSYGSRSGDNASNRDTLFAIPAKELSLNHEAKQNKGF